MIKTEKMYSLVDEYRSSGLSMRDFAVRQGIKLSTFSYWVRKKKQSEDLGGGFLELRSSNAAPTGSVEVLYPNGVRIITDTTDLSYLHALVKLY